MADPHSRYSLRAPGAGDSSSAVRLPGRDRFPLVDDHLDPPEETRWERIDGRRVEASPAQAPHAIRHSDLDYVVRGKAAPGYCVASDLKTRFAEQSDFASDTAVLKDGVDPATGRRYLEDIAFEVVSKQSLKDITKKALKMTRRGVRRVFVVYLKKEAVLEWSPEQETWIELDRSAAIEDSCLIEPLAVAALLDATAADDAVASGLVARGNRVIEKQRAQGHAEAILEVLEARGLSPSDALRQRVHETMDLDQLRRWLKRAAVIAAADELLDA